VIVTGNFTSIEIWAPDRFDVIHEAGTTDLAGGVLDPPVHSDSRDDTTDQKEERGHTTPMTSPRQ
jgi:hypothetical protein